MIENRLRTPGRKIEEEKFSSSIPKKKNKNKSNQDINIKKRKKESPNISQEKNNTSIINTSLNQSDQMQIYKAEIYTLNQKIDQLNNDLNNKNKNEELQKLKENKLQNNLNQNEEKSKKQIEDLNLIINDLKLKNSILEKESEYKDIINYYETKINELQETNLNNIHMFSNNINKYMKNYTLSNKDDVWRKLIKTYENKICDLEKKIIYFEGQERKMKTRQIFFEKFCYKAEKKIEEISKYAQKCEKEKNEKKNELKNDIQKYKEQINSNKKDKNDKLKQLNKSPIKDIKKEIPKNKNIKKKIEKEKEIENENENEDLQNLKEINENIKEWEKIRETNQKNINQLYSEMSNETEEKITEKNLEESNYSNYSIYDSKNIIMLLNNIHEFIKTILIQINDEVTLESISKIINDIKNYTIMLFDKIKILNINQCYIIDLVCDLNKNLTESLKKINKELKKDININKIMTQLKTTCNKLTNEFKP